jgi:alcohol dehydrogenase
MKAARLNKLGEPLRIEDVPDPILRANSVIVKVLGSQMMSYTHEVMSGSAARIAPPIPYTPGVSAIGVVETVADDVIGIDLGQKVFCSPHVVVQPNGRPPESILIGWFGLTPRADKLLALWKNGAFAEKALYPAVCVTPLAGAESVAAEQLACLNILTIAYGALLKGPLRSGQTVVVNGATGNIGACVVLLALTMGAAKAVSSFRRSDHEEDGGRGDAIALASPRSPGHALGESGAC